MPRLEAAACAARGLHAGRGRAAGLAQIGAARRDGRWDRALAPPRKAEVPADLQAALEVNPAAQVFFAELKGAYRYAVLYRIQDGKKPATRQARIDQFVGMLARGVVLHPPRPRVDNSASAIDARHRASC
ncbi:MAG: YdeI/OmpD-associated family protein [Burkholderiales bacterium]|nr:YdeI/OmpD-associated family protein [Burkholderiales bacterium]MDE1927248.1 YdeI/OmpD-associated family protein [Burkholderiales bacterium]MDE2158226.1 YdeI/OmpD-associated family protein [Burkholderiales bacterium]MDE2504004.1 YdeI/OmpD-associated family protein [Burkholderiales bacterium]